MRWWQRRAARCPQYPPVPGAVAQVLAGFLRGDAGGVGGVGGRWAQVYGGDGAHLSVRRTRGGAVRIRGNRAGALALARFLGGGGPEQPH